MAVTRTLEKFKVLTWQNLKLIPSTAPNFSSDYVRIPEGKEAAPLHPSSFTDIAESLSVK